MGRPLGQHFLTDVSILDRIVGAIDPAPDDVVIEIGAGEGTLTRRLAARVGRVVAIETDRSLAETTGRETRDERREKDDAGREDDGGKRTDVVLGDALQLDWHDLVRRAFLSSLFPLLASRLSPEDLSRPFKVIGNIPYYITTPLIDKALTPPLPEVIVFLVQREVAERIVAQPGSRAYGGLSIGVRVLAKAEQLFTVKAGAFRPPPRVDSAVLRLTPLAEPLITDSEREDFQRFLAALFGQRRKQLKRGLRAVTGLERQEVEARLSTLAIDPTARPETLPPRTMVRLYRAMATVRPARPSTPARPPSA